MVVDISGGKVSDWNDANLKFIRVHDAQSSLNLRRRMMDSIDMQNSTPERTVYNYETMFNDLISLYFEVVGKLKNPEILKGNIDELKLLLKNNKPHEIKKSYDKERVVLNKDKMAVIEEKLFSLEMYIRILLDEHGLSTRNQEVSGEAGYD